MSNDTHIHVNGQGYMIDATENSKYRQVEVTPYDDFDLTVTRQQRRKRFFLFGKEVADPIDKIVQDALNAAVCQYENKESREGEFEQRITDAAQIVKEIHESEPS